MGVYLGEDKVANGGFIGNYDSLPVGSVIEFDGDEVPVGYEEVEPNYIVATINAVYTTI